METARPTLVGYRDRVTGLMEAGGSFGVVENAINESAGLSQDAKAALWRAHRPRRTRLI